MNRSLRASLGPFRDERSRERPSGDQLPAAGDQDTQASPVKNTDSEGLAFVQHAGDEIDRKTEGEAVRTPWSASSPDVDPNRLEDASRIARTS